MGIKFKQIDNLQNTFDSMSGGLQGQITRNINDISGVYNDSQILSGWKYFANNVDISGAQGLLVQNDNIYTPNTLIAGGVKVGFPISSQRNSTPLQLGALQVTGGQIYFENQLNIRNNAGINIENGSITGNQSSFNLITGEEVHAKSGIFEQNLTLSGQQVLTSANLIESFTGLNDTPSDYSSSSGKYLKVSDSETSVEYVDISGQISSQEVNWLAYTSVSELPSATDHHGMFAHVHDEGAAYMAHAGSWVKIYPQQNQGNGSVDFTGLNDTPSDYSSSSGKYLKVSDTETSVEYVDISGQISSQEVNWLAYTSVSELPSATDHHGMFAHVHDEGAAYMAHAGSWVKIYPQQNQGNGITPTYAGAITLGSVPTWVGSPEISVSRPSLGNYRLTFSSAFASASSYHVVATLQEIRGNAGDAYINDIDKAASSFDIDILRISNGDPVDDAEIAFLIYEFSSLTTTAAPTTETSTTEISTTETSTTETSTTPSPF